MAGADVDDGREGALYLPAAQWTQWPRRERLSCISEETRDAGILPVEMQRERVLSNKFMRKMYKMKIADKS